MATGTVHNEKYTAKLTALTPDTWVVYGTHFDTIGAVKQYHKLYEAWRNGELIGRYNSLEDACEDLVKLDD